MGQHDLGGHGCPRGRLRSLGGWIADRSRTDVPVYGAALSSALYQLLMLGTLYSFLPSLAQLGDFCHQVSTAQHSEYTRQLGDLPWQGLAVRIWLTVHRYRCRNRECARQIFCERVPGVARGYARRTEWLTEIVGVIGYVAGGLPAARLLERLSIRTSDDTVRRLVRRNRPEPQAQQPVRYLGVDDWAWRKFQSYGTILVDLERHRVADLLPDRSAESLALWLEQHPTVEVIARDRGGLYADGGSKGAPFAMQVADRFHLVVNLSATIERVLEERSREL